MAASGRWLGFWLSFRSASSLGRIYRLTATPILAFTSSNDSPSGKRKDLEFSPEAEFIQSDTKVVGYVSATASSAASLYSRPWLTLTRIVPAPALCLSKVLLSECLSLDQWRWRHALVGRKDLLGSPAGPLEVRGVDGIDGQCRERSSQRLCLIDTRRAQRRVLMSGPDGVEVVLTKTMPNEEYPQCSKLHRLLVGGRQLFSPCLKMGRACFGDGCQRALN